MSKARSKLNSQPLEACLSDIRQSASMVISTALDNIGAFALTSHSGVLLAQLSSMLLAFVHIFLKSASEALVNVGTWGEKVTDRMLRIFANLSSKDSAASVFGLKSSDVHICLHDIVKLIESEAASHISNQAAQLRSFINHLVPRNERKDLNYGFSNEKLNRYYSSTQALSDGGKYLSMLDKQDFNKVDVHILFACEALFRSANVSPKLSGDELPYHDLQSLKTFLSATTDIMLERAR